MLGSKKDIEDAKKISSIFADISEESKMMAIVYLSALPVSSIPNPPGTSFLYPPDWKHQWRLPSVPQYFS